MPPSNARPPVGYRPDIDGLRAIAVLSVLFFHVGFAPFGGGYVGVDVFFVISGFLITRLVWVDIETGRFAYADFFLRRARRLLPAFLVTLSLTLAAGAWVLDAPDRAVLGRTTVSALLSVSNIQFWLESDYFNPDLQLNPLLHTWSLAVEEQFYLLWPLMLSVLAPAATRVRAMVLGAIVTGGAWASQWALTAADGAAFFLLPFRAFELGLGAALVWGVRAWRPAGWQQEALTLLGLAFIAMAVLSFDRTTAFPGFNALLPCSGAALVIIAGNARWTGSVLRNRIAVGIGLVSYSLYLVHWPLVALYRQWVYRVPDEVERWGIVLASLVLAALMFRFVESPFRRPRESGAEPRRAPRPGRFVGGAVTMAVALMVPSAAYWYGDGLPRPVHHDDAMVALLSGRNEDIPPDREPPAEPVLRIAVIGDSHASLYYGLRDWGDTHNVQFFLHFSVAGCPPLLGVRVKGDADQAALCERGMDRALAEVGTGDYDAVVLAARWGLYTGELTPPDGTRPRRLREVGGAARADSLQSSRRAFVAGLERTVDLMDAAGKPVLFVGQVPPLGMNPYTCAARQMNRQAVERRCRAVTLEEQWAEAGWATRAAQKQRRNAEVFAVFDPFRVFCDEKRCRLTGDRAMFYRDADHLSQAGARHLAQTLGPAVLQLGLGRQGAAASR